MINLKSTLFEIYMDCGNDLHYVINNAISRKISKIILCDKLLIYKSSGYVFKNRLLLI